MSADKYRRNSVPTVAKIKGCPYNVTSSQGDISIFVTKSLMKAGR